MRLDLLLRLDVEDLQRTLGWASASVGKYANARERGLRRAAPGSSASRAQSAARTFQREDLLVRVHDSRVGGYGSAKDIVGVGKVDDDKLVLLVAHANEVVGLQRQVLGYMSASCASSARLHEPGRVETSDKFEMQSTSVRTWNDIAPG